ncbi:MAG: diaminopimelate decarboxylase [Alphaproteobacteria bacterium]|nr:diaminopimelate decarboxylase [Alphaproteobacteria bacterium]
MHYFTQKNGQLFAEQVAIATLAQAIGTPFYCYSAATLRHSYRLFAKALQSLDATICYSVKANANLSVLAVLGAEGAGADIVSEGELRRASAAGIAPEKIVFSGIGKTAAEIIAGLQANIAFFNVESAAELVLISQLAEQENKTARIAVRVNPDIDAGTHAKITTGKAETKFGIAWEDAEAIFAQAAALPNITACGLDIHIGSQITDLAPFRAAFDKTRTLLIQLRKQGHKIDYLDLGGGLGVSYESAAQATEAAQAAQPTDAPTLQPPTPQDYASLIAEQFGDMGCHIFIEPGRVIAGHAGILVTSVIRTKKSKARNFIIVDAAMTELLRPALYGAYHHIAPINSPTKTDKGAELVWDIVGPVCETSDFLGLDRRLIEPQAGDLFAIFTAGAYGAVLGSDYNSRLRAPEIIVDGAQYALTRPRPTYDALLAQETIAHWLPKPTRKK